MHTRRRRQPPGHAALRPTQTYRQSVSSGTLLPMSTPLGAARRSWRSFCQLHLHPALLLRVHKHQQLQWCQQTLGQRRSSAAVLPGACAHLMVTMTAMARTVRLLLHHLHTSLRLPPPPLQGQSRRPTGACARRPSHKVRRAHCCSAPHSCWLAASNSSPRPVRQQPQPLLQDPQMNIPHHRHQHHH